MKRLARLKLIHELADIGVIQVLFDVRTYSAMLGSNELVATLIVASQARGRVKSEVRRFGTDSVGDVLAGYGRSARWIRAGGSNGSTKRDGGRAKLTFERARGLSSRFAALAGLVFMRESTNTPEDSFGSTRIFAT